MGIFKKLPDLIPKFLEHVNEDSLATCKSIFNSWSEWVDPKCAPFTKPILFEKGILTVQVKTSLVLSILTQEKKKEYLQKYKVNFPKANIRDIVFRVG